MSFVVFVWFGCLGVAWEHFVCRLALLWELLFGRRMGGLCGDCLSAVWALFGCDLFVVWVLLQSTLGVVREEFGSSSGVVFNCMGSGWE